MDIAVKATCSACLVCFRTDLKIGQEEVRCPNCGHTQKNLPESELREMQQNLSRQMTFNLGALVCFALAALLFLLVLSSPSGVYKVLAAILVLASAALAFLGARIRYIIEF